VCRYISVTEINGFGLDDSGSIPGNGARYLLFAVNSRMVFDLF